MERKLNFENERIDALDAIKGMNSVCNILEDENEDLRLMLGGALLRLSKMGIEEFNLKKVELPEGYKLAVILLIKWGGLKENAKAILKFNLGFKLTDREKKLLDMEMLQ